MPDFTKGADHLTIDSLTSFLRRNPKGADMQEMVALMQQIDTKFRDTPQKTMLSALLKAQLQPVLDKIRQTSETLGDVYGHMLIADVDAGRLDRLVALGQLCALNCFRLKWSKNDGEPFDTLRKYVAEKHKADIRNPADRFMYVPARGPQSMELWMMVDELAGKGGVITYENVRVELKGSEGVDTVTIIQLCDIS